MRAQSIAVALVALVVLASSAGAFVFELEAKAYRCFTEEVASGVDVNVTYVALPGYAQFLDVKITDPDNKLIFDEASTNKGHFMIATDVGGDYAVCFYSRMVSGVRATEGMHRAIRLSMLSGSDNVDYQQLASAQHMKPMEMSIRIVEDGVRTIHAEYQYFKEREATFRDSSEHMHNRVMWVTIISMGIFVGFAALQVQHLTKYFRRKRMID
jgi:hypothetical protein